MKPQASPAQPKSVIQWPQFPSDVFYKLSEAGQQTLQKWHGDITFSIQRVLEDHRNEIDAIKQKLASNTKTT
jgi:DNA-binding PadR family transcriptional regulator